MNLRLKHTILYSLMLIFTLTLASVTSCGDDSDKPAIVKLNATDSTNLAKLRQKALEATDINDAIKYANEAREQAALLNSGADEVRALLLLFQFNYKYGKNAAALNYASVANHIADSIGEQRLVAETCHALGKVLCRFKNNPISAKNFAQAFLTYFTLQDTFSVTDVWHDLIPAYLSANIFDSALNLCQKCLFFENRLKYESKVPETYALMGSTELAIFRSNPVDPDVSHLYAAHALLRKAEGMNRRFNSQKVNDLLVMGLTETLFNLAFIEKDPQRQKAYADSCFRYLAKACQVANNTGVPEVIHRINILGVKIYNVAGDKKGTKRFVDSLVAVAEQTGTYIDKETAYRAKSLWGAYNNDFNFAFENRVLAEKNREVINYNDTSFIQSIRLAQTQMNTERGTAKRRQQILEDMNAQQRKIITITVIGITLLLLIITLVYQGYRRIKKLNATIKQINEEMQVQSEEIRSKNEELMDGINYASIIQNAAMPSQAEMRRIFGDNLTFFSPRNIVSGDFYWASEDVSGRYKLLAVGDCTGHGVPGALLSMLGMSILDYTTRHFGAGEISAGTVLDKMRNNFKRTLNQTSFRTDMTIDSIDIALLVFDTLDKSLHYAAAFRPLLLFRYGEMMRMKADSMPIGIYPREKPHFTDNVMKLYKGDIIYLYSDGMVDQEGYEDAAAVSPRAYTAKKFFKLLKEVFMQPFDIQHARITTDITNWRMPKDENQEECELTDDATLVGVAVNNFINFEA